MELKVSNLQKSYRRFTAIHNLSFSLLTGIYGLLGENGAGKSTLMRILTTVDRPTFGWITCDGVDIYEMDEDYRGLIGYMPQDYSVYPGFTAREFLAYMGTLKGINPDKLQAKIDEVLEFVNLADVAGKKVKTFSGGMKRRIGIAQAIINDPKILILDEPTAGLDPTERNRFSNILSAMSKDKIILLSTHIVSDIETTADRLIVLKKGSLVESGTVDQLIQGMFGQVFEATMNHKVFEYLRNERIIIQSKPAGTGIHVRYTGAPFLNVDNKLVEPTLEDYYIACGGKSMKEGI